MGQVLHGRTEGVAFPQFNVPPAPGRYGARVQSPRVLLELDESTRIVLREGVVLGNSGSLWDVRWEDGELENLRTGRRSGRLYMAVPQGALRHRWLTDPQRIRELLASSPADVFVLALRESEKPLTSRQLIDRLRQDFADIDVSAIWKGARSAVESRPDVRVTGRSAQRKYHWIGSPPVAPPDRSPRTQTPPIGIGSSSRDIPVAPLPAGDVGSAASNNGLDPSQIQGRLERGVAVESSDAYVAGQRDQSQAVIRLIHAALPKPDGRDEPATPAADDLKEILDSPLTSGVALGGLKDDTLAAALPGLGRAAWVLLSLPRQFKPAETVDAVATLGPEGAAGLLTKARDQLRLAGRDAEQTKQVRKSYRHLVRRVLSTPSANRLPPSVILQATAPLAGASSQVTDADWVAKLLTESLASAGVARWATSSDRDKAEMARRFGQASLRAGSGRAKFLTWLWRVDRDTLADMSWWRNVGIDDLIDVATTPLADALESQPISDTVVRPKAEEALGDATTRRRLMDLLAAPAAVARTMSTVHVREAFDRVLRKEEITRPWLAEIAHDDENRNLRNELASLGEQIKTMRAAMVAAQSTADDATRRLRQAEDRLAQAAAEAQTLRGSQARQIRLDALRALADVASYVHGAIGSQAPERITQRINTKVGQQGIFPIAEPGEKTAYQPRLHELIGPDTEPGQPVIVSAVGYILRDDGEVDVVLTRALVQPFE